MDATVGLLSQSLFYVYKSGAFPSVYVKRRQTLDVNTPYRQNVRFCSVKEDLQREFFPLRYMLLNLNFWHSEKLVISL